MDNYQKPAKVCVLVTRLLLGSSNKQDAISGLAYKLPGVVSAHARDEHPMMLQPHRSGALELR